MRPVHGGFGPLDLVAAPQKDHLAGNGKGGWAARTDPQDEEMKMAYVNTHRESNGSVAGWFGDVLAKWNEARARRAIYVNARAELQSMTDRDLADIGVSRVQIEDLAHEAAYGK